MSTPTLYDPYFTPEERSMLASTPIYDLASEIHLLRVLISRVLAAAQRLRRLSLAQHASLLAAFSASGTVMARMAALQSLIEGPPDLLERRLEAVVDIAMGKYRAHPSTASLFTT